MYPSASNTVADSSFGSTIVYSRRPAPNSLRLEVPETMATPNTPVQLGTCQETWEEACKSYGLNAQVRAAILNQWADVELRTWRHMFPNPEKIETWIKLVPNIEANHVLVQSGKMGRMLHEYKEAMDNVEKKGGAIAMADLDDLLSDAKLVELHDNHWTRNHASFPTGRMPSDALVSRLHREITKRQLSVYDLWGVRNRHHQITTSNKKEKVGLNLWTEVMDEGPYIPHTIEKYLAQLHTYLLALSIAGSNRICAEGAQETRATDPTTIMEVPYDTVMQYYYRACDYSQEVAYDQRLAWLRRVDTEERSLWVKTFRETSLHLGTVIKELSLSRAIFWQPPMVLAAPRTDRGRDRPWQNNQAPQDGKGKGRPGGFADKVKNKKKRNRDGKGGNSDKGKGKGASPLPRFEVMEGHSTLKDGTAVCAAYNTGKCKGKGKGCKNGKHVCSNGKGNGRACGGPHPATSCPNK